MKVEDHVTIDVCRDYFTAKLADVEEMRVEEHLAGCDTCAGMAHRVFRVRELMNWNSVQHGELYLRGVLGDALSRATILENTSAPLRARIKAWKERWDGRAEAALRVVMNSAEQASRALVESLETLARPGSDWHFELATQSSAVRGVAADAVDYTIVTAAGESGEPLARVSARADGEVVVRIDSLPPESIDPIVLLIPTGSEEERDVMIAEAVLQPGSSFRLARFSDLAAGEYIVAFEPLK